MPFYYDVYRAATSDASAGTEKVHLLFLTVANQLPVRFTGIFGAPRSTTAGGAMLLLKTGSSAGSGGTAYTPGERNPDGPAASCAVTTDATAITPSGGTLTNRVVVSLAQTGSAPGGWVAMEPDHAVLLKPNAGANGNAELYTNAASNSMPINIMVEFTEG